MCPRPSWIWTHQGLVPELLAIDFVADDDSTSEMLNNDGRHGVASCELG